jgi:hypothetical protein
MIVALRSERRNVVEVLRTGGIGILNIMLVSVGPERSEFGWLSGLLGGRGLRQILHREVIILEWLEPGPCQSYSRQSPWFRSQVGARRGDILWQFLLADVSVAREMPVERRGWVIVELGQLGQTGRSLTFQRKAAAFVRRHEPDDARVSSPDLREARGEIPWAYSA